MPKNKDDMVRWGDVEAAVRQIHREQTMSKYLTKEDCDNVRRMLLWTLYQLEELPVVDAVEVVRCKDCEYWQDNNGGYPHEECRWGKRETPDPDDFCSFGERKDNG